LEKLEIGIGQVEPITTESGGQIGPTPSMSWVSPFVDSAGIMEHGEQLDDFDVGPCVLCEAKAILEDPGPVGHAVRPVPWQGVVFQDDVDEGFEVKHELIYRVRFSPA
jgi:hypothetical protein